MRKFTKRSTAVIAATVIAVGGGAAAWAAWTANGSATASAATSSAQPVTVANAVLTGPLQPGPKTGVTFRVENPNSFAVVVTSVTFTDIDNSKQAAGCNNNNYVGGTVDIADVNLPAGNGATITAADAVGLISNPNDNCQGAGITFKVTANAASTA